MRHSIVVPAHNEATHLEASVEGFLADLTPAARSAVIEVILVENGSTDATLASCERLREKHRGLIRVLSNVRGSYGEAIKRGMMESTGTHLSLLECDLLDAGFVARSVELLERSNARVVVASKRHPRSIDRRPFKRRLLTWGFNCVLRITTGYPGSDTHGLKSLEGDLARQLCRLALTSDEAFQTELVLLAWRLGHPIIEVPIELRETRPTPVAIARRLPSVLTIIGALRHSLSRFPAVQTSSAAEPRVPGRVTVG